MGRTFRKQVLCVSRMRSRSIRMNATAPGLYRVGRGAVCVGRQLGRASHRKAACCTGEGARAQDSGRFCAFRQPQDAEACSATGFHFASRSRGLANSARRACTLAIPSLGAQSCRDRLETTRGAHGSDGSERSRCNRTVSGSTDRSSTKPKRRTRLSTRVLCVSTIADDHLSAVPSMAHLI